MRIVCLAAVLSLSASCVWVSESDWQARVDVDGDGVFALDVGGLDCDDLDPAVRPDVEETWYDGIDQDCDGADDFDQDGDGYVLDDDCDDTNDAIHPGAAEVWYDGIDQDCDEGSDYDQDGDGVMAFQGFGSDCDDTDATVFPGAEEIWYDGIDQNCDDEDDFDQDGDGFLSDAFGGKDCDDTTVNVGPDEGETCNGRDDDCNGLIDDIDTYWRDADGDGAGLDSESVKGCEVPEGYVAAGTSAEVDCDDTDPLTYPGASPVCGDWVDNDCGTDTEQCIELRPIWPTVEIGEDSPGRHFGTTGDFNGDGVLDLWAAGVIREGVNGAPRVAVSGYAGPFQDGSWPEALWEVSGEPSSEAVGQVLASAMSVNFGGQSETQILVLQQSIVGNGTTEGLDGKLWLLDPTSLSAGAQSMAAAAVEQMVLPHETDEITGLKTLSKSQDSGRWYAEGRHGKFALLEGWPSSASPWDFADVVGVWDIGDQEPVSFRNGVDVGDVDGDGEDDLVVGSGSYDGFFSGALLLSLGPLSGQVVLPQDQDARLEDPTGVDGIGIQFCLLDFDGDGRLEVLDGGSNGPRVGARAYVGAFEVGVPHPTGDVMRVGVPFNILSTDLVVSCPGDLNNDGVDDLMLGNPRYNGDGGLVAAFFGPAVEPVVELSQSPGLADLYVVGDGANVQMMGGGIHPVGDMDGDGSADVVVSETSVQGGVSALWLFRGPSN